MKQRLTSIAFLSLVVVLSQNCAEPRGFGIQASEGTQATSSVNNSITGTGSTGTGDSQPAQKFAFNYPITLIGWMAHNQAIKAKLSNLEAGFQQCPVVPADANMSGDYRVFCYEPSGANGMYFGAGADETRGIKRIKKLILPRIDNLIAIKDLSFLAGFQQYSNISCFQEAAFMYGLAQLALPSVVTTDYLEKFSFRTTDLDDGAIMMANNSMLGNTTIGEFRAQGKAADQYSLHSGKSGQLAALHAGINDLSFILADNCKNDSLQTVLAGAAVMFNDAPMVPKTPHVVQGYVYAAKTASALAGATVELAGEVFYRQMTVGADGFFEFEGAPPGAYELRVFVKGSMKYNNPMVLGSLVDNPWLTRVAVPLP